MLNGTTLFGIKSRTNTPLAAHTAPALVLPGVMASYFHQVRNERVEGLVRMVATSLKADNHMTAPETEGEVCPEPEFGKRLADTPPPTFGPDGPDGGWTSGLTASASRPQRTLSSRTRFLG